MCAYTYAFMFYFAGAGASFPAVGEYSCAYTPKQFKLPPRNFMAFRSKAKTHRPHFIFQQQQLEIVEEEDGKNELAIRAGMGKT